MGHVAEPAGFRAAASRFATGITVVATGDQDGAPIGMTANSFTTISAKPPTVLVSLTRGRTWQAVARSGIYSVNVLHADDAALSAHFAGRPLLRDAPPLVSREGFFVLPQAIAQFACEVVQAIDVADHTLFIGEVRWCRHNEGTPLAFYASRLRKGVGMEISSADHVAYPGDGWWT
ncbi:flavin reductase family protein [Bradyrhizobium sp. DOA9]|uniref:flavin reductase family protein n=1 Tax=Bradyrhizobium sp. DOA9 TaxID=1126627 RepID=UPI00046A3A20|nr:flavin reductase family protein [Bradyrhizobium sp. DOA9]